MNNEEKVNELLKKDLFFPKMKMQGFLYDIYCFWELWIIRHHIERNKFMEW